MQLFTDFPIIYRTFRILHFVYFVFFLGKGEDQKRCGLYYVAMV